MNKIPGDFGIDMEGAKKQLDNIFFVLENKESLADAIEGVKLNSDVSRICLLHVLLEPAIYSAMMLGIADPERLVAKVNTALAIMYCVGYAQGTGNNIDIDPDIWGEFFNE